MRCVRTQSTGEHTCNRASFSLVPPVALRRPNGALLVKEDSRVPLDGVTRHSRCTHRSCTSPHTVAVQLLAESALAAMVALREPGPLAGRRRALQHGQLGGEAAKYAVA
eukprot:scaffold133_cov407-Prasinococcus_capsulatus_cf.AAC.26